jgi:hypothetical protein
MTLAPAQANCQRVAGRRTPSPVRQVSVLFYVPDEVDPRFQSSGAWWHLSATLLERERVDRGSPPGTAPSGVGLNGAPTTPTGGSPAYEHLVNSPRRRDFSFPPPPPSPGRPCSTFRPYNNAGRYEAWSARRVNGRQTSGIRATSFPHPSSTVHRLLHTTAMGGAAACSQPVSYEPVRAACPHRGPHLDTDTAREPPREPSHHRWLTGS